MHDKVLHFFFFPWINGLQMPFFVTSMTICNNALHISMLSKVCTTMYMLLPQHHQRSFEKSFSPSHKNCEKSVDIWISTKNIWQFCLNCWLEAMTSYCFALILKIFNCWGHQNEIFSFIIYQNCKNSFYLFQKKVHF